MHYIRYDLLYGYVLSRLQHWYEQIQQDEERLLKQLLNTSDKERIATKKKHTAELRKAVKRKSEVDGLFAKMYEDWSARGNGCSCPDHTGCRKMDCTD